MKRNLLDFTGEFTRRHIGPSPADTEHMLATIGADSMDRLIEETIPAGIRRQRELAVGPGLSEHEYLSYVRGLARRNRTFRSFIGLGYYGTITPPVIQRNVFENPGWYTAYTPYQAEIAQGRLEALLNFQTLVIDLTGLDVANASLLDEATAAAEAMTLMYRSRTPAQQKAGATKLFLSKGVLPQTIDVLNLRARPLGIELVYRDFAEMQLDDDMFAAIIQYPDAGGAVHDYRAFIERAREKGIRVIMAADPLSLVLLTSPGELGADVAIGSMQRFGVPMGYGGPHAAYMAVRDEFKRQMPGRLIGVSVDSQGDPAYRMSLQTREQHIRREKATSNICTAQALLANMAGFYAVFHGPEGLRRIAARVHLYARMLADQLAGLGFTIAHEHFFDTIRVDLSADVLERLRGEALKAEVNFYYPDTGGVVIALDETVGRADLERIAAVFAATAGKERGGLDFSAAEDETAALADLPADYLRKDEILTHPVFHSHHSETGMMRYLRKLEGRDLGLNTAMIPLGSCTMKLNAAVEMMPLSMSEFAGLHPFVPADQAAGYHAMIEELERDLCEITGFTACSLQPNSGAQGEYAGLMVIRAYHHERGNFDRDVVLIPTSAHGTNPASAVMAGMDVVLVQCDDAGNVDLEDLQNKAARHADRLSALMITYPSTHGVFEEEIRDICETVHRYGGQVYLDGANMNAQVGLTAPAELGADVCHLNLHKTFAIPHGGGGPGMGPICVAEHLAPFLPGHSQTEGVGGDKAIASVSAAPYGSALILLISHAYIKLLGDHGLRAASEYAILGANYIKARLEKDYPVLYTGQQGRVAHEMILDIRPFKKECGIDVEDIAKRLMDFGFHAPTMSWPIAGTLMVEPTESEPREELDRFCDAMLTIRAEIREIESGAATADNNVVRNAPHTARMVTANDWSYPYSREQAAYPDARLRDAKFWPAVGRIDNVYGDRNLICACPPLEVYAAESQQLEESAAGVSS